MMKGKNWDDIIKPIVVLVVICLLSSAALALANSVTAPIIAEQQKAAANAAYLAVLPEADNFEEVTEFSSTGVQSALKATNGAGWVIKAAAKGFGGDVPVVVGFDGEGNIVAVQFMENSETAGFGSKLADGSEEGLAFAAQFAGKNGAQNLGETVDGISGATVSSKAAVAAVNNAVNCFNEVALGQAAVVEEEAPQLTTEQAVELVAGGPAQAMETIPEGLAGAYKAGDITVLVAGGTGYTQEGYGDPKPLTAVVGFDAAGAITSVWVDVSQQTEGIGDVANSEEFVAQFAGINNADGLSAVDTVAGATESTVGVKKAVRKCVEAYAAMNGAAPAEGEAAESAPAQEPAA